jgi:hypothetical protein
MVTHVLMHLRYGDLYTQLVQHTMQSHAPVMKSLMVPYVLTSYQ